MVSRSIVGVGLTLLVASVASCASAPPPRPQTAAAQPAPPPPVAPSGDFDPEQAGPGGDGDGDGDGDGVEVSGMLGTLDRDRVNEVFQRHWDSVSRCYQSNVAGRYYLAGDMTVKVRVAADGSVKSAEVARSDLGSYPTERCILGVVLGLRFPKPHGGPEAELSYPFQFPARAAIVTWDPSRIAEAVARQRAQLASCQGTPPPGLVATLYVGPGGAVQSAGLSADGLLDDGYAECVVSQVSGWTLPEPSTDVVKVQLPLD